MVFVAVTAALICICSWITVPYTVPFTMQTFAVFFALLTLGGADGTMATGLYILLGMVGLPVFSGFTGGIGHIIGPTGGYIVGFIFMGIIYMAFERFLGKKTWMRIVSLVVGLLVCYLFGSLWFAAVYSSQGKEIEFFKIFTICVVPYIVPDMVKLALATALSVRVRKALESGDRDEHR